MPSSRDILRSAFTRFLPGWLGALVAFPLLFAPHSFLELGRIQFALLTVYSTAALAGHALVLAVLSLREIEQRIGTHARVRVVIRGDAAKPRDGSHARLPTHPEERRFARRLGRVVVACDGQQSRPDLGDVGDRRGIDGVFSGP